MADRKHRHRRGSPEERSSYKRDRKSSPRAEREGSGRDRRRSRSPHGRSDHREHERGRHRDRDEEVERKKDDKADINRHTHKHRLEDNEHSNDERFEKRRQVHDKFSSRDRERLRDEDLDPDRRKESGGRDRHRDRVEDGDERLRERREGDRSRFGGQTDGDRDFHHRRKRRKEREEEEDVSQYEFGGGAAKAKEEGEGKEAEKDKPNYGLSGKLAAETNTFRGILINYSEPPEARIPKTRWRLYPFKGDEALATLYIHRQSAYLVGRDRRVCDMPIDHPSCSKQHAVIQYRLVEYTKDDGTMSKRVRPYVIDLESTNGTYLNNQRIDPARYYELKEQDMLKFGFSSREYVILHENSKDEVDMDDGTEK